jgi:hypothetical protein
MGTPAPPDVPEDEIWLDVGGRAGLQVLDHHGGDTPLRSAMELVAARFFSLVPETSRRLPVLTLVLHNDPDVDAVSAAWLAARLLALDRLPAPLASLSLLASAVGEHDQGMHRAPYPLQSWALVLRTLLREEYAALPEPEQALAAFKPLDMTWDCLVQGGSLEDAAARITTPLVRKTLERAARCYAEDLRRGWNFKAALPLRGAAPGLWGEVDALFVPDPESPLVRELAQADTENSREGRGFTLFAASKSAGEAMGRRLWRYSLVTNPASGFHLEGLGQRLEAAEKAKEDAMGLAPLPGRERLGEGGGRHGMGVRAPWYDGRGHGHTILESPALCLDGKSVRGSVLSPEEMLDTLARYSKAVSGQGESHAG